MDSIPNVPPVVLALGALFAQILLIGGGLILIALHHQTSDKKTKSD